MFCCYEDGSVEKYDEDGIFHECGRSRRQMSQKSNADKTLLYTILTSAIVATTILSNLAAIKVTSIAGFPVDCGFICYPVTFLLTDILNQKFGLKRANYVTVIAVLCNLIISLVLSLVVAKMVNYPEWTNQTAFAELFNFGLRVTIASSIVCLTSHILDNVAFTKLEKEGGTFIKNSFYSSLAAQVIDSVIFIFIAFYGTLSIISFIKQLFFSTLIGLVMQIVYLAICAWIDFLLS